MPMPEQKLPDEKDVIRRKVAKLNAFFEEVARLVPPTTPVLSDEALRRRSLYSDAK